MIYLHDNNVGDCSVVKEEWLLKFGASSVGLGLFFGVIIFTTTWVLNANFVGMFPVSKLNIEASTVER